MSAKDYGQAGPAVGYELIECPECSAKVIVTFQGYRIDAEKLDPGKGDCGLMTTPGGQVLVAGMGDTAENRYRFHDHQPEGLE